MDLDLFKVAFRIIPLIPQIKDVLKEAEPVLKALEAAAPTLVPKAVGLVRAAFPDFSTMLVEAGTAPRYDVRWLQNSLNSLGANLRVDGEYGDETKKAVREFQARAGLEQDGWAGIETCAAITAALDRLG